VQFGIDILLMLYDYYYLYQFIDEVHKFYKNFIFSTNYARYDLIFFFVICGILSFLLLVLNYFLKDALLNSEKDTIYECGFQAFSTLEAPFTLQFYKFAILFLIFDVEILFLLPMAFFFETGNVHSFFSIM
jgi:NADH-quinone oxidoreductase subunit A